MMRLTSMAHEFVDYIPEELRDGTIYISIRFATVSHKCCCGCGRKVVTPISPTDWTLIFDGDTISLDPSIGNWNLPCQSHYWIIRNRVKWSGRWSKEKIDAARSRDRDMKERYFNQDPTTRSDSAEDIDLGEGLWQKLLKPLSKKRRKP